MALNKIPESFNAFIRKVKCFESSRHVCDNAVNFLSFFPKTIIQDKKEKEPRHDFFLRKFEYTKALDSVLKPYVQQKYPEYTYSVLKELKRYDKSWFLYFRKKYLIMR